MKTFMVQKIHSNGYSGTAIFRVEKFEDIPFGNNIPDDVTILVVDCTGDINVSNKPRRRVQR